MYNNVCGAYGGVSCSATRLPEERNRFFVRWLLCDLTAPRNVPQMKGDGNRTRAERLVSLMTCRASPLAAGGCCEACGSSVPVIFLFLWSSLLSCAARTPKPRCDAVL